MKQAKAVYAFTARSEAELSFVAGDEIVILEEDPSGWGKGRTKEYKEGYFPLAYVQVEEFSDSDSDEDTPKVEPQLQCIALYDFTALSDTQLSFLKGDVLKITKKGNDNDWWGGNLERTHQKGLFPSNYVKLVDQQHDIPIIITPDHAHIEDKNNFKEPAKKDVEAPYAITESVVSKQHKKDESRSNFRVEDSFEDGPSITGLPSKHDHRPSTSQNASFATNLSPLDVSVPFELHTGNHHREFATLSPISPNLSALTYDTAEMARRRHSMNISSTSPLSLSAFSGEYTRDFDALCLLYPFVPSSVSQNAPPSQQPLTPTKIPTSASQPTFISPHAPTDATPQLASQPIPIPVSHQALQLRPQSAPQSAVRQPANTKQPTPPQTTSASQTTTTTSQSSSISPKPSVPKLSLISSPDRKEPARYSNRERSQSSATAGAGSANTQNTAHTSSATAIPSHVNAKVLNRTTSRYGPLKSPARRDPSSGTAGASKRKVKLEASLSLGKKPNATITHSNTTLEQSQDTSQASTDTKAKEEKQAQTPPQQNEVEYLKKILQQEIELRAHLESVVHDAHGKMHSASQYIKDLKAELFQAHMDISQLRVTNRQLNEQLDKYQLVTRVTVSTQTERDENIDKIRVLTEQIHELEANTDLLNEQIAILKNKTLDRSPRNVDRSPRGDRSGEGNGLANRGDGRVDYAAVKQQFARVRECLLMEKEIKDRLIIEKAQVQEKLVKAEQSSKQIRRKLLTELQLKSDLNVRNQQIELQMQKLKEELATFKSH